MKPPFEITPKILRLLPELGKAIGVFEGVAIIKPDPQLRKRNAIRTIHSSLAIEGNTLSLDQVTTIFDNKKIVGPLREINEVKNAIRLYQQENKFRIYSEKDFLKAHDVLMNNLLESSGKYRTGNVGIIKGNKVKHVAPKANHVAKLMNNLFAFIKNDRETPLPILSAIFHYEMEFIHPFDDGNGRMGRFWQHLLLKEYHEIFSVIPFETTIRDRQEDYYLVLSECDKAGDSTKFIEFSLEVLIKSLRDTFAVYSQVTVRPEDRLLLAESHFKKNSFSRKNYLDFFKDISTATASRDLANGVNKGLLEKIGDKARTSYKFAD
jgi:Fic family protein